MVNSFGLKKNKRINKMRREDYQKVRARAFSVAIARRLRDWRRSKIELYISNYTSKRTE